MHAVAMKRCSSVDERPGCGHDVEVVMTLMCLDDLMSKMRFVGHGHCLPYANSVERIAIDVCTSQGEERHPKDYFRTNISH